MKNALWIHILMGVLTIVPLILFNIRKIWVRRPPAPVKFKVSRCIVISVICIGIAAFLTASYQSVIGTRYEIAVEKLAEKHAEMLTGRIGYEDFRTYLVDNGGDGVGEAFDRTMEDPAAASFAKENVTGEARFQFSGWVTPKYWQGAEAFAQTEVLDDTNPVYIRYVLEYGSASQSFTLRMRYTDDGWKFDDFGVTAENQFSAMKMTAGGKWFTIKQ